MAMTVYKLYAGAVGDSAASLDIQLDGEIEAIMMGVEASGVQAADEGVAAEVSFMSTSSFTVNDTRGSLMMLQYRVGLLTSGMAPAGSHMAVGNLEIPVGQGERIHLHVTDFGTVTARRAWAYIYVRDRGIARTPTRRR